jgi:hypothetical protein
MKESTTGDVHEMSGGCLSVTRTREQTDLLADLVIRNPGTTRHRIAAAALIYGLRQLTADPVLVAQLLTELKASSLARRRATRQAVLEAQRVAAKAAPVESVQAEAE